jgi:hypothetical protein
VVRRWGSDRPSRSSFQTTGQSPGRMKAAERLGQAGTVAATATGSILKQATLVDPGGEERVMLQVPHLTVALGVSSRIAVREIAGMAL